MYKISRPPFFALLGLGLLAILGGCTGDAVDLDSSSHKALLESDRQEFAALEGQTVRLTLFEALDRGVEKNLDARVAAIDLLVQKGNVTLKELEVLPQFKASRKTVMRSNVGASSSRSVESGLQSLEPSQSTDRRRMVTEMTADWNLLDAGLALADTYRMQDETGIVGERYAKVIQNIERDVYAAYWRAWEYQNAKDGNAGVLREAERQAANLEQAADKNLLSYDQAADKIAEIDDRGRAVQDMENAASVYETELKSLLSFPQSVRLELVKPDTETARIRSLLNQNPVDQEWIALQSRPEMREEVLQKNVAIKNVRQEIFKTFPGAEALLSYNTDTNSFLQDPEWSVFSFSLTQNVLDLLTLPLRYEAAKTKEYQADAHRQALGMSVVAQVHLARQRLAQSEKSCRSAQKFSATAHKKSYAKAVQAKAGFSSGGDRILASLDARIADLRRAQVCADLQDSYAAMLNSLGQNLDHGPVSLAVAGGRDGH